MFHEFTWWGQQQLWPTYRPTVNNPSNVKDDKLALFKSRSGTCLCNARIHHAFALVNYIDELKINSGSKCRPKLSGGGMIKSTCIGCTRLSVLKYTCILYIVLFLYPPSVRSFVRLSVRPSQSLIRYSSKTAEQNFMKISGIVHYMMPYCTSYFTFYPHDFGVSQSKTRTLPLRHMGGPISNPLLLQDRRTEFHEFKFLFEWLLGFPQQNTDFVQGLVVWGGTNLSSTSQNFIILIGFICYMMTYPTSYYTFWFDWFLDFPP